MVEDEVNSWIALDAEGETEEEEGSSFTSLRPTAFSNYIGQGKLKESLRVACAAAKKRKEALDHVLLYGPPGLGKTSLARILATEMNVMFKGTSGPVIERPGDLAALLTGLESHCVLFIDEIHRLPRAVEEILYPAMEDFEIDILIGQGPAAKSVKIPLKPFTLVGATTRSGLLTSPLRDRFGITERLDFYTIAELQELLVRSAGLLSVAIQKDAAEAIAKRSRGTPRIANRILKRVRDYVDEQDKDSIDQEVVAQAMESLDIDDQGLTHMDREFLRLIIEKFSGGPVGLDTLAAGLAEDKDTIEDMYEPYLIQAGFLARTKRGRIATEQAAQHLGLKLAKQPESQNLSLFK